MDAFNQVVDKRRSNHDVDYIIEKLPENSVSKTLDRRAITQLRQWLIKQGFYETEHLREALLTICDQGLFYDDGKRSQLYQMLADQSRGAGIRLWFLKNRNWT